MASILASKKQYMFSAADTCISSMYQAWMASILASEKQFMSSAATQVGKVRAEMSLPDELRWARSSILTSSCIQPKQA
jgi:hypothetical protein